MFKKLGTVTIGVAAGLVVAAPLASAGEATDNGDSGSGASCEFNGGDAGFGASNGDAGLAGNVIAQAGTGGSNVANALNCSNFLNHNLDGNNVSIADIPIF